jgi:hypothetical protein
VGADVGECAGRAAELGLQAPAVLLGRRQPVLEIAAVKEPEVPELAGRDAGAHLDRHRVVAVRERAGRDATRGVGGLLEARGLGGVHRQRLLAHHVLAGLEGRFGKRRVQVVGRAETWTMSTSGSVTSACASAYARAPSRVAASSELAGVDAATPARRAPAKRADRACTAPMKPAPTIPTRRCMPAAPLASVAAAPSPAPPACGRDASELLLLSSKSHR